MRQAIETGVRNQPAIEALREHTRSLEGGRLQASLKPNPRLNFQWENLRTWQSPGYRPLDESDIFMFGQQTIEAGGKRERRMEFAESLVNRSQLDRELLEKQIGLRVAAAYWTAVGTARLAELAREQVASFEQLVENNRQRVAEGLLPEIDLIRSQIELQRLQATVEQSGLEVRRAQLQLLREMGIGEETALTLTDPLDRPSQATIPDPTLVKQRTEWQQADQNIRVSAANERLQEANAKMDPMYLFGYKRANAFDTVLVGFQIDLPFRHRNQGAIASAKADTRAAAAQQKAVELQISSEIKLAWNEVSSRRQLLEATLLPNQKATEQAVDFSRRAYAEGGVDLLRLIDAERTVLEARTQVVRTQMELRQAEANLAYAVGEQP